MLQYHSLGISWLKRQVLPCFDGPRTGPHHQLVSPEVGPVCTRDGLLTEKGPKFRHDHGQITLAHAGSWRLRARSSSLSHGSGCLLIAHVAPLRNSSLKPEIDLCGIIFHVIVMRYVLLRMLKAVESRLCLLEVFEVYEVGSVRRRRWRCRR